MGKYFRFIFISFGFACVSLFINAGGSFAKSEDKSIVLRKKIEAQKPGTSLSIKGTGADSEHKRPALAPRSDFAENEDNDEVDNEAEEVLMADYKSANSKDFIYHPKGKIDPFEPLFKNASRKAEDVILAPQFPPKGHIPGDLEKIDLSQLKLTGVIITSNRNLGLVQEASGKGHIISTGTYIGTRGGRVSTILKDKVIIKETLETAQGKIVIQKSELKLGNKAKS
jgi:type IV pilus assembly protein PilP